MFDKQLNNLPEKRNKEIGNFSVNSEPLAKLRKVSKIGLLALKEDFINEIKTGLSKIDSRE